MATANVKQDMPPPGGYKPITYNRIPAKSYFSGYALFGGYLGITFGAAYIYYLTCVKLNRDELEMRSARLAIYPLLLAERDREYLKQLRRNRDEERKLMENVEGWEVGTYYGEPVYKTLPEGTLFEPTSLGGYFVHASIKDFKRRAFLSEWS